MFQPFLRFYVRSLNNTAATQPVAFQPFLRFYRGVYRRIERLWCMVFQPFLRFYSSCGRFLLVFKFFCCFFVFLAVGVELRFTFISHGVG